MLQPGGPFTIKPIVVAAVFASLFALTNVSLAKALTTTTVFDAGAKVQSTGSELFQRKGAHFDALSLFYAPRTIPLSAGIAPSLMYKKRAAPQSHSAPHFSDLTEHPANRALHFALELGTWGAFGAWGYQQGNDLGRYALMLGLPLATIATWTLFAVPHDPWLPGGRNGTQPRVPIPGWARFTYEMAVHALAAWAFYDRGWTPAALGMAGGTFIHYTVSYQRVAWLFGRHQ